jgi:hypothetical protein
MSGNKKKVLILGGLGLVFVFFLVKQLLKEDPVLENWQAPTAQSEQTEQVDAEANSAGGPAPSTKSAVAQSQFEEVEIDIDQLLDQMKEVDFDYDEVRDRRDPFRPLVGPTATRVIQAKQTGAGGTEPASASAAVREARSMMVSGIIWDKEKPVAVVDGVVVYPGFKFEQGIGVEEIQADRVIVRVNDTLIPLTLEEQ